MSAEHPILFSAPMVRALLDGSKTQTRRVVKGLALEWRGPEGFTPEFVASRGGHLCPYGQPGDRLWVREAWGARFSHSDFGAVALHWNDLRGPLKKYRTLQNLALYAMRADDQNCGGWIPSIHMPRWASRITLEVTGVRVERLQDISEADAVAEGIETMPEHDKDCCHTGRTLGLVKWPGEDAHWARPSDAYASLWESINGPGSWDANPWVWVVEFRRVGQQLPDASKTIAKGAT